MPLLPCPNDNGSMQTVQRSGVEFDICPTYRRKKQRGSFPLERYDISTFGLRVPRQHPRVGEATTTDCRSLRR